MSRKQRGNIVRDPTHLIDLMPTCVEAARATYPSKFHDDQDIQPMEGISLLPALQGSSLTRDAAIGFEHHGNLALRDGRYKIVSAYRNGEPTTWELYDMLQDRTELNDLSEKMPEKKQELIDKWQAWADRVGVKTWPLMK
jgi:arylsulfatase